MKGIILAGGTGSRLYPITLGTCKQLLPVYDKPMIYYPLSVLMLAGIQDILLIGNPEDLPRFHKLFDDGSHLGINISYAPQAEPLGIAQSFLIAESFLGNSPVALILGDNLFYGHKLQEILSEAACLKTGAQIFGYPVKDPERYGVLSFNSNNVVNGIIEKPAIPPSPYAVPGLYFYDNQVIEIAKQLTPSARGELEITEINQAYLQQNTLAVHLFERGFTWLDTGTPEALWQATAYVQAIQERQGTYIACIEEIAYRQGFISKEELFTYAKKAPTSSYGTYLKNLTSEDHVLLGAMDRI